VDASGNLFIADTYNNRIRKVSASGIITTVAGNGTPGFSGDGGPATSASLNDPVGVSPWMLPGISSSRTPSTIESGRCRPAASSRPSRATEPGFSGDGGPATSAALAYPTGVAVDASGNLFIADTGNNRIRKVSASGIITTVAGNGTAGFLR
jgi:trimeric autotransporter adhesin